MKTARKTLVAAAVTVLLTAGITAPAQAAPVSVAPQASSICIIFPWWPWNCA